MANKLTKEKLDLLIEHVLSEVVFGQTEADIFGDLKTNKQIKADSRGGPIIPKQGELSKNQKTNTAAALVMNKIAPLGPNPKQLESDDLQYLIDNPSEITTDIMYIIYTLMYGAKDKALRDLAEKVKDQYYKKVDDKALEPQTFSQPKIQTATAEQGKFPDEVKQLISKLEKKDLAGRIEEVSNISKRFYLASGAAAAKRTEKTAAAGLEKGYNPKEPGFKRGKSIEKAEEDALRELQSMDLRKFISQVMLMEYFVEISKSFDSGTGGYVFEWFLALLAGGRVTGKETGPGGGMGAVDFRYDLGNAKGRAGSAKYYNKIKNIKQAAGGFKLNEPVGYVIAIKKQGMEQVGEKERGTSDPARLIAAEIYTPAVKLVNIDSTTGDYTFELYKSITTTSSPKTIVVPSITIKGKEGKPDKIKPGKLVLDNQLGDPVGIIFIADTPIESFRDMMSRAVGNLVGDRKKILLEKFEAFFTNLDGIDTKARIYSSGGDISKANEVINDIAKADDDFNALIDIFNKPEQMYVPFQENKTKSLKELDKLIERVILNKMNKL